MNSTLHLGLTDPNSVLESEHTLEVASGMMPPLTGENSVRPGRSNRSGLATSARRLAQALADAGRSGFAHPHQPLVGPNGAVVWTSQQPWSSGRRLDGGR
jgi:hypothetical protein